MSYTLYFSPDSANLVVRMVLEELHVDYDDTTIARKRSERSDAFFALNPRGLLPVLVDHSASEPVAVAETGAILLYLADKHSSLAPKPTELEARAACLKWLFMLSNTLHADLAITFYAERYANSDEDCARVRKAASLRVMGHLDLLNRWIAETDCDWFLPSGLSICDFYLGCCVRWAQIYPSVGEVAARADVMSFSALAELLSRAERLQSVQTALDKEGIQGRAFVEPVSPLPVRVPDGIGAVS